MSTTISVDSVLEMLRQLSPRDRLKVIAQALPEAERELELDAPLKSLYGLWEGVSISAEDIDEARREMWANFPRDDI